MNTRFIDAYGKMVRERLSEGWTGYLVTIHFRQMIGSRGSVLRRMEREIQRIYARMLTRLIRNPRSQRSRNQLPVWIAVPDYPVPKHRKQPLRRVVVNDGLHWHVICLIPPLVRIKTCLVAHLERFQKVYVRDRSLVDCIHGRMIHKNAEYVVRYGFKAFIRRRFSSDDILLLPRAWSELSYPLA